MAEGWSRLEVEATVADYFDMWTRELRGEPVNKARHNSALRELLNHRSKGAVEFKHQNISAVLIELGFQYIEGYKPRANYQEMLREVVEARTLDMTIRSLAEESATEPVRAVPAPDAWSSIIVEPPSRPRDRVYQRRAPSAGRITTNVNYLEMEAHNRSVGLAGEEFVLGLEHRRLREAGQRSLADRIVHASKDIGDGLGYDIQSFELDGRERLIEVKTTRYGEMTPFFASRNEVEFSDQAADRFHLFRVFNFARAPKAFVLPGPIRLSVDLEPSAYRASIRWADNDSTN